MAAHSDGQQRILTHTITGGFDSTHFRELEIEVRTYGRLDGHYSRGGLMFQKRFRREPGESWTRWEDDQADSTFLDDDEDSVMDRGSFKVRVHDEGGSDVIRALTDYMHGEFGNNTTASGENPDRRYSFALHLVASNNDENLITEIKCGPFSLVNALTTVTVRMR